MQVRGRVTVGYNQGKIALAIGNDRVINRPPVNTFIFIYGCACRRIRSAAVHRFIYYTVIGDRGTRCIRTGIAPCPIGGRSIRVHIIFSRSPA